MGIMAPWLVDFPLIPVMPYLIGKKKFKVSIPFVITIIYLIMGIGWGLWHPGWIIFLLVPVITTLIGSDNKKEKKSKEETDYIDVE